MKCNYCGKNYPSRYYFKTTHCCAECFERLGAEAQQQLLASDSSASPHEGAQAWTIAGKSLVCPVCANEDFWKRKTLMNTPGLTFFGIEWANRQAINYVCNRCGYVFWFLVDEERDF